MNKVHFDRMFDAAFEASAELPQDSISVDYRPSWQRVQQKISAQRHRKNFRSKLTRLSVVAASLLLGALIFGNTQAVKAIEPIYATLKEYPSGVMSFFFGRSDDTDTDAAKAKTIPPPDYMEGLNVETVNEATVMAVVTKAQASMLLSFHAPDFHFIPEGYSLNKVQLYFYDGRDKADHAAYLFITDKGKILTVSLQMMKYNIGLSANHNAEDVTVEQLQLKDGPAIITQAINGSSSLETISNEIHITMSGIVSTDDLVRMYEEMVK